MFRYDRREVIAHDTRTLNLAVLRRRQTDFLRRRRVLLRQKQLHRLIVNKYGLKIEAAEGLSRLGNYDTVKKQFDEFGDKAACISIGQAGEMLTAAASVAITDVEGRPTRHCGRGGMGADC